MDSGPAKELKSDKVRFGDDRHVHWAEDIEIITYFTPDFEFTCRLTDGKNTSEYSILKKMKTKTPTWTTKRPTTFLEVCNRSVANLRNRRQERTEIIAGKLLGQCKEIYLEDLRELFRSQSLPEWTR